MIFKIRLAVIKILLLIIVTPMLMQGLRGNVTGSICVGHKL